MKTKRQERPKPRTSAKKPDDVARIRAVEDDPGALLRRAAAKPVRLFAKTGARNFHIATIRRGATDDPASPSSLPLTLAALKRRAGRILRLASSLQVVLRIETAGNARVFYIEPGSECLEFAAERLGGAGIDAALLRNALRHSKIVRAATELQAKKSDAQRRDEIDSLRDQIARLERAAKKHAALAEELAKSKAALRQARVDQAGAAAAAQHAAEERRKEASALTRRIAGLERSLKKQTALGEEHTARLSAKHPPDPEVMPEATDEGGPAETLHS